jgi:hypothetical protein
MTCFRWFAYHLSENVPTVPPMHGYCEWHEVGRVTFNPTRHLGYADSTSIRNVTRLSMRMLIRRYPDCASNDDILHALISRVLEEILETD